MLVTQENKNKWDELHNRLLSGDVIASAEIAEYFMPLLINKLNQGFQTIDDPHLIDTAVIDTLMDYLTNPNQYNSNRGNLYSYFVLKAKSDLLNYLRQKKIDHSLLNLTEIVELDADSSVYSVALVDDVNIEMMIINELSPIWDQLNAILPEKTDQEIVKLIINGIRDTSIYAEVIGIQNLTNEEKSKIVKQYKDRIKKVIQRHFPIEELKDG